jgi:putative methionine-R-sulfoxide reductase with GAF domain
MSDPNEKRPVTRSDTPARDLRKQKDEFLQNFGIGAKLSGEMLAEYERLIEHLRFLEGENAKLRAVVEADSAVRELLSKIARLEKEKAELVDKYRKVEASIGGFPSGFQEIEAELNSLANLLVASRQLSTGLSPRGVMRRIKEVLAQLVGAERYAIYFANDDRSTLVPIASEGLKGEELVNHSTSGGLLGEVFSTGRSLIVDDVDTSHGSLSEPPAIVPLVVDEKAVGVIVVYSTLAQKTRFDTVDYELFNLLGNQAAWALVSATLFAAAERRLPGLDAFVDLSV